MRRIGYITLQFASKGQFSSQNFLTRDTGRDVLEKELPGFPGAMKRYFDYCMKLKFDDFIDYDHLIEIMII